MDLSQFVDLLSVIAVVSGLIFAGVELRQYRLSQKRESAFEIFNTWHSLEVAKSFRTLIDLPDNLPKKDFEQLDADEIDGIFHLLAILEGMGVLVYQREIDLEQLEEFYDGLIITFWRKMNQYIEERRKTFGRDTFAEYTQWLAEKVIEREKATPAIPAYIKHKDWQYKK